MSHIHWVGLGAGTPKDRDKVNNRDVCECENLEFWVVQLCLFIMNRWSES